MAAAYSSPEYTHCISDPKYRYNVYEPEADTFLFLEALDKDVTLLRALHPRRCIEIGCGSGTVVTHLRCLLMPTEAEEETRICPTSAASKGVAAAQGGPQFSVVDVNPLALEATAVTWTSTLRKYFSASVLKTHFRTVFNRDVPATLAGPVIDHSSSLSNSSSASEDAVGKATQHQSAASSLSVSQPASGDDYACCPATSTYCLHRYHGDLFNALHRTALQSDEDVFDVVLFNPPYVPTSMEELQDAVAKKDVITAAWCGGPRGRVVLDRFLQQLPSVLSRRGSCYLVLIKENDVADVAKYAQDAFRRHLRQQQQQQQKQQRGRMPELGKEEDVVELVEMAARYTGEHLSVHRLRYLPEYRDTL